MSQQKITKYFKKKELTKEQLYKCFRENLYLYQDTLDEYLDIDRIIYDLENSIKNNNEGMINRCTECNIDMGRCNPRQLCGKTYCQNNF